MLVDEILGEHMGDDDGGVCGGAPRGSWCRLDGRHPTTEPQTSWAFSYTPWPYENSSTLPSGAVSAQM